MKHLQKDVYECHIHIPETENNSNIYQQNGLRKGIKKRNYWYNTMMNLEKITSSKFEFVAKQKTKKNLPIPP